jgi:hypothetical protein
MVMGSEAVENYTAYRMTLVLTGRHGIVAQVSRVSVTAYTEH